MNANQKLLAYLRIVDTFGEQSAEAAAFLARHEVDKDFRSQAATAVVARKLFKEDRRKMSNLVHAGR